MSQLPTTPTAVTAPAAATPERFHHRRGTKRRAYGTGGIFTRTNTRGDVTYYVSYRVNGKTVKESARSAKLADAERLLQRRMGEVRDGELAGSPLRVKVSHLLDDVLTDYNVNDRSSLKTVKTHIEGKKYGLRKLFGHMKATKVKRPLLVKTLEDWKGIHNLTQVTCNRHLETLRRAYTLGVENGRISKGAVPDFPINTKANSLNARQTYVGVADMRNIISTMPDGDTADFVDWLYGSSQRWGEAAEMEWAMFHQDTWEIHIPGTLCKNGLPRVIPVVEHLRPIIERRLAARRLDCPFIFYRTGRSGTPLRFVESWRKGWRKGCEGAGHIGKRDGGITPHDLRHIAATDMRRSGIPESVIEKIGGWEKGEMFKRYAITDTQEMVNSLGKLSAYRTAQAKKAPKVVPIQTAAGQEA